MSKSTNDPQPCQEATSMAPGSSTRTSVDDAVVDRLALATVGYLKAKLLGDDQAADLIRDTLGPDILVVGLTAALTSTARASVDPNAFLEQLAAPSPPRPPRLHLAFVKVR